MQFKIDENLPIEIAQLLMKAGHDAKTVHDQHLQGTGDKELIEKCDSENRIMVTADMDFSDIRAYPPQDHEGIIVLRVINQSRPHVIDVFEKIVLLLKSEPIRNRLWIIEENVVRIRGEND